MTTAFPFSPADHRFKLLAIIELVMNRPSSKGSAGPDLDSSRLTSPGLDTAELGEVLRQHPKPGGGFYSKAQILQGFREFHQQGEISHDMETFVERMRMKPIRTASGVAPVTVLTRPHPCPGKCIFCPSDVRMPKSYLSDEPGAQRAAEHEFDPWRQTMSRLLSFHNTGHSVDKVELIILGGTWSFYPEGYQRWFVKRCFDALNEFDSALELGQFEEPTVSYTDTEEFVDGRAMERTYNQVIEQGRRGNPLMQQSQATETATWEELESAHRKNEAASVRSVGLVVETRPDRIDETEVEHIRRLGATKVQIGYQSLSDEVLELNRRGHDVAATRRAMTLLRQAGFKIHAHWMPNLYGSTPEGDIQDYLKIFDDPGFRPDELKIYPCSLIESAELMHYYQDGRWRPYEHAELLEVLVASLVATPEYCRLTRVIRDIPGTDIVVGNKLTNFRQVAELEAEKRGATLRDIRSREVRHRKLSWDQLHLEETVYETSIGQEVFLQYVTKERQIAAFLRLSLPDRDVFLPEIRQSAMIREVHVYGSLVALGQRSSGRAQHLGLGRRLIEIASAKAASHGFKDLAVISAIGTREYYRRLGFEDGALYSHKLCEPLTKQAVG